MAATETLDALEDEARDEWVRVARRVSSERRRVLGLLPLSQGAPSLPLARHLAGALAALSGAHVAVAASDAKDAGSIVGVTALARWIANERGRSLHLVVDLGGFVARGELAPAIDLVDGVILVGVSGALREGELRRVARAVPAALDLGVLLVDGRAGSAAHERSRRRSARTAALTRGRPRRRRTARGPRRDACR